MILEKNKINSYARFTANAVIDVTVKHFGRYSSLMLSFFSKRAEVADNILRLADQRSDAAINQRDAAAINHKICETALMFVYQSIGRCMGPYSFTVDDDFFRDLFRVFYKNIVYQPVEYPTPTEARLVVLFTAIQLNIRSLLTDVPHDLINETFEKETFLSAAVKTGNLALVVQLMKKNADAHHTRHDGRFPLWKWTPLSLAIGEAQLEIIEAIMAGEYFVVNPSGGSIIAIQEALRTNQQTIAEKLLSMYPIENCKAYNELVTCKDVKSRTLLHMAVENKDYTAAKLLLERKAVPDDQDSDANTALYLAVKDEMPDLKIVRLLMDYRADPTMPCEFKQSPIFIATRNKSQAALDIMLEAAWLKKYNLHIPQSNRVGILQSDDEAEADSIPYRVSILQRNDKGECLLQIAVGNVMSKMVEFLLEKGADPNIVNRNDGDTALHIAIKNHEPDMIAPLIKHGADVNIRNNDEMTPISLVLFTNYTKAANVFIKNGCAEEMIYYALGEEYPNKEHFMEIVLAGNKNFNLKRTVNGESLLHMAARHKNFSAVGFLMESIGHQANLRNKEGETPLSLAIKGGDQIVINAIVHSEFFKIDNNDIAAIITALEHKQEKIALLLLRKGNHADMVSVLHSAVLNECLETVEFLVNHKIDPKNGAEVPTAPKFDPANFIALKTVRDGDATPSQEKEPDQKLDLIKYKRINNISKF